MGPHGQGKVSTTRTCSAKGTVTSGRLRCICDLRAAASAATRCSILTRHIQPEFLTFSCAIAHLATRSRAGLGVAARASGTWSFCGNVRWLPAKGGLRC